MWILLFALIAIVAVVGVIAYRRHRAADRRWKNNLAESDRPTVTGEPIFTKATPRYTPRPSPASLTSQQPPAPVRRTTRPPASSRPATRPLDTKRVEDSSPFEHAVFTSIGDPGPFSSASAPPVDDDTFRGHGGGFGGAGASGGWTVPDPTPAPAHSHEPAPAYSADPSPSPDPSPSADVSSFSSDVSFSND